MKHASFFLLLVGLAGVGCKKDRAHTSAEGVVVDATTQARVGGARVYLLQTKGTSLYAAASRVQHTDADGLGNYSLSFEAEDDSRYALQATAPTFFDTPNGEYVSLDEGEKNKENLSIRPEAWLRIRFLSTMPGVRGGGQLESPVDLPIQIIGVDIDTTLTFRCYGNDRTLVHWVNATTNTQDYVYCPAHDTTDYTIRF